MIDILLILLGRWQSWLKSDVHLKAIAWKKLTSFKIWFCTTRFFKEFVACCQCYSFTCTHFFLSILLILSLGDHDYYLILRTWILFENFFLILSISFWWEKSLLSSKSSEIVFKTLSLPLIESIGAVELFQLW